MLKLNVEILFSSKFEHFSSILANFQEWRIKKKIKKKEIGQFPKEKKGRKRNWQVFSNRNRDFFFEWIKFEYFSNAANEIVVE